MDDIRNAILTDDLDALADLPVPETYQAMVVRAKDEQDMFDGPDHPRQGPAQEPAPAGRADARARARARRSSR